MRAYSLDLRERVWADCRAGMTTPAVAEKYTVNESWVRRLKQRQKSTGSLAPRPPSPGRPIILAPHDARARAGARRPGRDPGRAAPAVGLEGQHLGAGRVPAAHQTVVQKKVIRAAEQDRPDVKEKRAAHAARMPGPDPTKLVFLDETGANTKTARRYGRAPRGERLVDAVPHGHWKTTTFVAAPRADGLTAPMVIDGAVNGDLFVAYAEQVLVPTLRPGDVVVMDDLSSHKRVAAVRAIERAGCSVVYLSPYSPGYNPIEPAFAKVKARLRAAELRTIDKIEAFFGRVHDEFTSDGCRNYIRHAGYAATH